MYAPLRAIIFGFLLWVIAASAPAALFWIPVENLNHEALGVLLLSFGTMVLAVFYLRRAPGGFLGEGIFLGVLWLAMCVAIDAARWFQGMLPFTLVDYAWQVAINYSIFPIVTMGLGVSLHTLLMRLPKY